MNRRGALSLIPALPVALAAKAQSLAQPSAASIRRNVPRGFESLPLIGLGTWLIIRRR